MTTGMEKAVLISSRSLLRVAGNEVNEFLQGLITKDINSINISGSIYGFLLNAKGRILSDLLIYKTNDIDGLLLETDSRRLSALERTLTVYRMRRKVQIEKLKQYAVWFSEKPPFVPLRAFEDPRVPSFGYRIIERIPDDYVIPSEDDYVRHRMKWGFAEGFDEVGEQIPLQMNGDLLNGISFEKGCYIGQELIARTHHTGVIRRRVVPIQSADFVKIAGKTLVDENQKRQGKILRVHNSVGIALVSLNFLEKTLFDETGQLVNILRPKWWPENIS